MSFALSTIQPCVTNVSISIAKCSIPFAGGPKNNDQSTMTSTAFWDPSLSRTGRITSCLETATRVVMVATPTVVAFSKDSDTVSRPVPSGQL